MANEKPVLINPVPKDYAPSPAWYKVTDQDDWGTVAKRYGVDVQRLIDFNFRTNDPKEVNWYLRRNVGCKVSRDGGRNWAFSGSASPGKIYIPVGKAPEGPKKPKEPSGRNKLAELLDGLPEDSEKWDYIKLGLEIFEFGHMAVEMFAGVTDAAAALEGAAEVAGEGALEVGEGAVSVGGTLGVGGMAAVAAPIAGLAALALALGEPYLAIVNLYKRKALLLGLGIGVVLGANKNVNTTWIKTNFDTYMPGYIKYMIQIPGQEDQLVNVKNAYLNGIALGFKYGRELNGWETTRLYRLLGAKLDGPGSVKYYFDLGWAFKIKFLPAS